MMAEIYIAIGIILGLVVGMFICRNGIKERDKRINELENEITIKQNVVEAQNATINRLHKIMNKRNGK